jgi:hypothetical protein
MGDEPDAVIAIAGPAAAICCFFWLAFQLFLMATLAAAPGPQALRFSGFTTSSWSEPRTQNFKAFWICASAVFRSFSHPSSSGNSGSGKSASTFCGVLIPLDDSFTIGSPASMSVLPGDSSAFIIKQYVSTRSTGCNFQPEHCKNRETGLWIIPWLKKSSDKGRTCWPKAASHKN